MKWTISVKEIFLSIAVLLVGVVFWFLLAASIDASQTLSSNWENFATLGLITVFVFGLWLALIGLSAVLLTQGSFLILSLLTTVAGLVFRSGKVELVFGVVVVFITLNAFYYRIRRIGDNELRFRIVSWLRRSVGWVVTSVLLVTALMVYADFSAEHRSSSNTISTLSIGVGNLANQLLPVFVPSYNPDLNLDEFLVTMALDSKKTKPESEQDLPPELAEQYQQDVPVSELVNLIPSTDRDNLRSEFLKPFGLSGLQGDVPMTTVIQRIVDVKAQAWLRPIGPWIPPFITVGLFLLLNVFRALYVGIALVWLSLLHRLFLATGIMKIEIEQRKKEVPVLLD